MNQNELTKCLKCEPKATHPRSLACQSTKSIESNRCFLRCELCVVILKNDLTKNALLSYTKLAINRIVLCCLHSKLGLFVRRRGGRSFV